MYALYASTAILANGSFPRAEPALRALQKARKVVCCDGAAEKLLNYGREPDWIVGDMDSMAQSLVERFKTRIVYERDQQTNDLTKAFLFCLSKNWRDIVILGATGGREDHTLGNLSLLVDYANAARVTLLTDTGWFTPVTRSMQLPSHPGQQVSIFSFEQRVRVYAEGLKYPIDHLVFTRWWRGTLNEATSMSVKLIFEGGPLLVYQEYINPVRHGLSSPTA